MKKQRNRFLKAWDAIWGKDPMVARRSFSNERTGAGGDSDLLANMRLNVYRGLNRAYLETIYANFWAAAKLVDLKPNDVFGPGICWDEDEDESVKKVKDEMKRLKFMETIPAAVKAARLFGTAVVIVAPKDKNFERPLVVENIREGDISHLIIADRFKLEEIMAYGDPKLPKFGETFRYRWHFNEVTGTMIDVGMRPDLNYLDVHASRCIRFDGIPPITTDGWEVTERDRWGMSVLARALDDILQDAALAANMPDLVKRACVPVIKKQGWTEVLSRGSGELFKGEISPDQMVANIADNLNAAKLMIIDAEDDTGKLEVTTTGLNDIAKTATQRLAMIEGIPITRFTGESATGLSATGDGEARDWRITVEAFRKERIEPQWNMLMEIVSRSAGVEEVPEWNWNQLGEATMQEQVDTAKSLSETATKLVGAGVWDEIEAREFMNNSDLSDFDPDDAPEPDMELMKAGMPGSTGAARFASPPKPEEKKPPPKKK